METDKNKQKQKDKNLLDWVLSQYTLEGTEFNIISFGSGLINSTWKVSSKNSSTQYILQKINTNVFKNPFAIAGNIGAIDKYLSAHAPHYFFVAPFITNNGTLLVNHADKDWFRLMPFVENSITFDTVETPEHAYEAALAYGKFAASLHHFPANQLQITLPNFHNLSFRHYQFRRALQQSGKELQTMVAKEIDEIAGYYSIVSTYEEIAANARIPLRVMHHDTKISNCLFDASGKTICVIDLDTMMPGYYISDVGDMCRSFLCPLNEESIAFSEIYVRLEYFEALSAGYLSEMKSVLNMHEIEYFTYSGQFLIYMQALRFLTDFLAGNPYYPIKHPLHNLDRTRNQIALLNDYSAKIPEMQKLVQKHIRKKISFT